MHADAERDAGPPGSEFLDHLQIDRVRLAAPADVLRERQTQQAGLAEQRELLSRKAFLALVGRSVRGEFGVGQIAGQRDQVGGLLGGQFAVDRHGSPQVGTVLWTVPQYCPSSGS